MRIAAEKFPERLSINKFASFPPLSLSLAFLNNHRAISRLHRLDRSHRHLMMSEVCCFLKKDTLANFCHFGFNSGFILLFRLQLWMLFGLQFRLPNCNSDYHSRLRKYYSPSFASRNYFWEWLLLDTIVSWSETVWDSQIESLKLMQPKFPKSPDWSPQFGVLSLASIKVAVSSSTKTRLRLTKLEANLWLRR